MEKNYVCYHLHSDLSLLDSCTKFEDYITRALELNQKALCFTEHGNIFKWVDKKEKCDKAGIKYIHGIEVYLTATLTPKVRDNYHTILIAKNFDGVKEINSVVSISNQEDHFYFKPRITFEEFENLSDNVIKISACLASPLAQIDDNISNVQEEINGKKLVIDNLTYQFKKIEEDNKDYDKIKAEYHQNISDIKEEIKIIESRYNMLLIYRDKLPLLYNYYEIQPHINSADQIMYNKRLFELSKKNNIPLIAGTDTHSLNKYKAECRAMLQLAKGIDYGNEDEFDLTYKSYDELVEMFNEQGALPKSIYLEALENTIIMADSVEDFELDKEFKYPKAYDDDDKAIKERLNKELQYRVNQNWIDRNNVNTYIDNVKTELDVLKKIDMNGFMLFMADLIKWCKENNIPVGPGRGSVSGSYVAYLLGITDVDPFRWKTVFSRFANESRKEIGDIDVDFAPDDREKVYNHMIETFGKEYTAYILAITTVSDKGCIDEIGRALSRKFPDDDQYSLQSIKDVKEEYDKELNKCSGKLKEQRAEVLPLMKERYPKIFYYFEGMVDTVIAQSIHPAGMVVSPITLADNYGITYNKDGQPTLQIDMEDVHETGLVKYDILGLKNVGIIKDACFEAGLSYPQSHEINWNDQEVWKDMLRNPTGIFQFEGDYAFNLLKTYQPHSIFDMSLVTAAVRPSAASYRDSLMKKIPHENPSPIIDELLKDNYGYLVYQEDTIKFLQEICGLSGSEADNIRRAIGRKQKDRLDAALPSILEGYCKMSPQPREVAENEAKQFLQIIEDSAEYQFGYNHSVAYCMVGYLCAYLRYYYTPYFLISYLNNAKDDSDIIQGFELAKLYNIEILPPRFRYSTDRYNLDTNTGKIYKGIASIKYLSQGASQFLYSLRDKQYNSFTELLIDILTTKDEKGKCYVNSRQMEILIQLQYFEEFGKNKKLLSLYQKFNDLYGKKQIAKADLEKLGLSVELMERYATKETDKTYNMVDGSKKIIYLTDKPKRLSKDDKAAWERENKIVAIFYTILYNPSLQLVKMPFKGVSIPKDRMTSMLMEIERTTPNESLPIKVQMAYEKEALGYLSMTYNVPKQYCFILDVDFTYSPKLRLYSLRSGKEVWCKVSKKTYEKNPFGIGFIMKCNQFVQKPKYIKTATGFEATDNKEWWLENYTVLSNEEWEEVSANIKEEKENKNV